MPVLESLFNKSAGLQVCNFMKKRLQHRCFPVNIAKYLRTAFYIDYLWWLLLMYQFLQTYSGFIASKKSKNCALFSIRKCKRTFLGDTVLKNYFPVRKISIQIACNLLISFYRLIRLSVEIFRRLKSLFNGKLMQLHLKLNLSLY